MLPFVLRPEEQESYRLADPNAHGSFLRIIAYVQRLWPKGSAIQPASLRDTLVAGRVKPPKMVGPGCRVPGCTIQMAKRRW